MTRLMLRPGSAVEPVDEGLLFSGWSGSTLMRCPAGVAKVWRAVEPAVRAGFDEEALRARLPEGARGACDLLLRTLADNAMLMPGDGVAAGIAGGYLAYSAADPASVAKRLERTVVGVEGEPEQAASVAALLSEGGVETDGAPDWRIYIGGREGYVGAAVLAAVAVGSLIVVAPTERLTAALDRITGSGTPNRMTWAVARTVLAECLYRLAAGTSRPDRCFLIEDGTSTEAPLPAPWDRTAAAWPATEWRDRDDVALLDRFAEVSADHVGLYPAPHPGTLVQHPLAQQALGDIRGAGLDQASAGADAVLGLLRADAAGNGLAVAGDGPVDVLADAVGRFLVATGPEPYHCFDPQSPITRRWLQAATRLAGTHPEIRIAEHEGVMLARAADAWGYGADAETAAEHAVRGLLKTLLTAQTATPNQPAGQDPAVVSSRSVGRRVPVSHIPTAAAPLLRAFLGAEPAVADLPVLVAERVPGWRLRLTELCGLSAGVVEVYR